MTQNEQLYWYGLAALTYLITCWTFSTIRWFHTCSIPKDSRTYTWPDRKLQVLVYLMPTFLIPYIINPDNEAAWLLEKSYFPCTYYFYCGLMLCCFFGTVKQWNKWKPISSAAAIITLTAMIPLILNAWIPGGIFNEDGARRWSYVVTGVSLLMIIYCGLSMWQIVKWILESRDDNYSNPDDFPTEYAFRVGSSPLIFTPMLWPAYILDSPATMAVCNVLLAVCNIILLINVMQSWRRNTIFPGIEEPETEAKILSVGGGKR